MRWPQQLGWHLYLQVLSLCAIAALLAGSRMTGKDTPNEAAIIPEAVLSPALVQSELQIETARRFLNYSYATYHMHGQQMPTKLSQAFCSPRNVAGHEEKKAECPWGQACSLELEEVFEEKQLLGFVGWAPGHDEIVLAFRGTSVYGSPSATFQNMATDIDESTEVLAGNKHWRVHEGFHQGYLGLRSHVLRALEKLRKTHPNAPILVTGHSLGAALATVAAADLVLVKGMVGQVQLFSFGSPRVFNKKAAQAVAGAMPILRFTSGGDPAVHLPPCAGGCKEGGSEVVHTIAAGLNDIFIDHNKYWHVGREVWNPKVLSYEQGSGASNYKVCDKTGEDPYCSDSVELVDYDVDDHLTYLGIQANPILNAACGGGPDFRAADLIYAGATN